MLGFESYAIAAGYLLTLGSALFGIIWGIRHWNMDVSRTESIEKIREWAQEEGKVDNEF
jgi:hypothetical protein